jgi:hypothetical protein
MDATIAAWENEGGARQPMERNVVRRFASHRTLLIGLLYVMTIIVVLAIVSRL